MCEAQLWEEALLELKRQSYAPQVKRNQTAWLACIYLGMGRNEEVIALKDQARQDACDVSRFLAVAYARLGKKEKALRTAQEALRVRRQGATRALGDVYFYLGDYDQALLWYERAGRSFFERADVLSRMGKTLTALGDYAEACVVYDQAIRQSPFVHVEELRQLAECLRKTGQERAAVEAEWLVHERTE